MAFLSILECCQVGSSWWWVDIAITSSYLLDHSTTLVDLGRDSRVSLLLLPLLWRFAALETQSMDRDLFQGLDPTRRRGRILGAICFPKCRSDFVPQICSKTTILPRLSSSPTRLLETSIHPFIYLFIQLYILRFIHPSIHSAIEPVS